MKFFTDIHDPQRMNSNKFGDVLTFPSSATMRFLFISEMF